ncbi:MAG: helical backbone metal receptor, partial [Dehalococcoidia bacterium]
IIALAPTLVVANKEENRKEDILALRDAGLDVMLTDPNTVGEAVSMVRDLGERLGQAAKAESLAKETEAAAAEPASGPRPRVFVAVWKEPLMGLGRDTYGHDLIGVAGAVNVLGSRPRYPELTREELASLRPDLILLPDEPYPFAAADIELFAPLGPTSVIDGKLLWWYGPRMPAAIRELRRLFAAVGSE